ncbi:MAG: VPLPA-CTERM-specific exosortase XrtD [Pseudomonadota bacterium]
MAFVWGANLTDLEITMSTADRLDREIHTFLPGRAGIIAIIVTVSALGVLFWDAIGNLWYRWGAQQELSHSYFIPLISAWLVWTNRDAIRQSVGAPSLVGFGLLGFAALMLLLGQVTHIFVLQHLALVVAIAGATAGLGGLSLLRATAAPIAFLLFAVPPPFWFITVLSWKFQQISSIIGVAMIEAMNIPVYLSGNVIDLGDYKLEVAEACSGLRYLFPFMSIGVMTAYLFRGPLWGKLAIIASTLPITIIMNSFRIAMTGALVQAYGTEHAEGALHFFEGWVVFVLCLIALFGVVWLVTRFTPGKPGPLDSLGAPELKPIEPSRGVSTLIPAAAGVGAVALGALGLSQVISTDTLIIPERKSFASLPSEFPGWRTDIRPMDPTVAEVLGADDTIVMNLFSPEDDPYNLYVAYLEAQRDGRSWHSPRQCIPGGGWQISSHDILQTDAKNKTFNRLVIENRNQRQLVYYWYDQRGRMVANEFTMKFLLMFDAVVKKRSDGALVRLMTPVRDSEPIAAADARLKAMMADMEAFMPEYVPD